MPKIKTADGTNLYYEEVGTGTPIVFVHEFAGDYRQWEPQMRYFARTHRCVTYSQRGYPPSDVPDDEALYDYLHQVENIAEVSSATLRMAARCAGSGSEPQPQPAAATEMQRSG